MFPAPEQFRNCRGHVLLVTVCVVAIVGTVLIGYVRLATNQKHLVVRSQVWNLAMPMAEAGVDEALAHCNENNAVAMASNGWEKIGSDYFKTNWIAGGYYVARISDTRPYVIFSTGYYPIPTTTKYASRTVRVITKSQGLFKGAMWVRDTINLNGNNVMTDSFDSKDPTKSTSGKYDLAKAGDKGDVACLGGLVDSFSVGNANIWGHAYTLPSGSLTWGPNGGVGSVAWQQAGKSGVQPGWWLTDVNTSFPDVQAPYSTAATPPSGTVGGVQYDHLLGNGNYISPTLGKKVYVTGNAVLYVTGSVSFSSGDSLEIAPGASLTMYVAGQSSVFTTIINRNSTAGSFLYYGLPSNTSIKLQSQAALTAAIYAPQADITLVGAAEVFGSVIGKTATLTGSSKVHYDEALLSKGPIGGITIASWDEL